MNSDHMDNLAQPDAAEAVLPAGQDGLRVRRWFAFFVGLFLATGFCLAAMLWRDPLEWSSWAAFQESVRGALPATKLLIFAMYLSLACTFLPLHTGWLVSALAMQGLAVTSNAWSTILIVSAVGAAASTLANLNDYHIFTLMMRSRKIARIRHTRIYKIAVRWFNKSPFALLLVFNLLPIPIDVARILAATHRYPRLAFAVANYIGRFGRYAVIAGVTWQLGRQGWIATVSLLAVAIVMVLGRLVSGLLRKNAATNTVQS
jgi:membrane protein YqaA with SNARE-associated domain